VREEVELLEHHAHLRTHLLDGLHVVRELGAVDDDAALLVLLEAVDAADERRLSRADGPQITIRSPGATARSMSREHVEIVPVPLVDLLERDDRVAHELYLR
jgi:hypothetical protein